MFMREWFISHRNFVTLELFFSEIDDVILKVEKVQNTSLVRTLKKYIPMFKTLQPELGKDKVNLY